MSLANSAHRRPGDRALAGDPPRARHRLPETLLVLSRDAKLLATVRSVAGDHGVAAIGSETELASQLVAGTAGVALIDAAAAATPVEELTQRLAAQFPELVLVVAGNADHQGALAPQVTSGIVHRFLHKPVSDQRVRLFVDAAWRRHEQEHSAPAAPTVAAPARSPRQRTPVPRAWIGAIAAAIITAAGGTGWYFFSGEEDTAAASAPAAAGRRDAVASVSAAATRNDAELERLLAEAETALVAGRIDAAERAAAAALALRPDHARAAFLGAQIGKERENALLTRAREAAAGGDLGGAIAVLEGAARQGTSTLVAETRRELEQQAIDTQVAEFLRRAEERMTAGALLEPAQKNARFFIESARALAPQAQAVRTAQRALGERLTEKAAAALAAGELDAGGRWLEAAGEAGASRSRVMALRRDLQTARRAAHSKALARLHARFTARLGEQRLIEPREDSAKHWLAQLAAADPQHPSTQAARRSFASEMLAQAREATAQGQIDAASAWLAEARAAAAPVPELDALEREIAAARAEAAARDAVVSASTLKLVRSSEPRYPLAARQRDQNGWVDLEFTVGTDGSVGNVTVLRSEPAGLFEAAATEAVAKWRYRPVMRDGHPAPQRARLRIRFALE
ncbi:MAG TPA: energy transducer TonB [Steroidobacteraceae bacterium]|nr:energy transducer TonB [Steroidobacteraceae bacterium]